MDGGLLLVELGEVLGNHLVGDRVVLQVTLDEGLVGRHVDESVAGEVEEDDFFLACLFAFLCFADGGGNSVATLWCRDDTLGASEEDSSFKGLQLWDVYTVHESVLDEL